MLLLLSFFAALAYANCAQFYVEWMKNTLTHTHTYEYWAIEWGECRATEKKYILYFAEHDVCIMLTRSSIRMCAHVCVMKNVYAMHQYTYTLHAHIETIFHQWLFTCIRIRWVQNHDDKVNNNNNKIPTKRLSFIHADSQNVL